MAWREMAERCQHKEWTYYLLVLVESVHESVPDFLFVRRNDVPVVSPVSVVLAVVTFVDIDYVELARHLRLFTVPPQITHARTCY